jgi:hypothetical protein
MGRKRVMNIAEREEKMKRLLSIDFGIWDLFVGILVDFGGCPKFETFFANVDEVRG